MDVQPYASPLQPAKLPRTLLVAGFLIGAVWLTISLRVSAALGQSLANRMNRPAFEPVLEQALLLGFVTVGLSFIDWLLFRRRAGFQGSFFPRRASAAQEAQRGVALGWGAALLTALPMLAAGALHPAFAVAGWSLPWLGLSLVMLALSLVTLILAALTLTVAFQGFFLRWLGEGFGPSWGAVLVSLLYAILWSGRAESGLITVMAAFLLSLLLCLAYMRTHGLWLAWGLRTGWTVAFGVVLGLHVAGASTFNGVVTTEAIGPAWLTGGGYGPDGSAAAVAVLVAGIFVLYRATRSYAWEYTHAPIVGRAYAVVVAPPAAHVAMEQAASTAPVPLVQILSSTSTRASLVPEIEDHLRSDQKTQDQN